MPAKTIYLVWTGEYSGASVVAAFSEEFDAIAAMERWAKRGYSSYHLGTCELNPEVDRAPTDAMAQYMITLSEDGTAEVDEIGTCYFDGYTKVRKSLDRFVINTPARSTEEAIKIAHDMRTQWIADREGLT